MSAKGEPIHRKEMSNAREPAGTKHPANNKQDTFPNDIFHFCQPPCTIQLHIA
jgi:hypothetical protein